jgi:CBS domain-containing protein
MTSDPAYNTGGPKREIAIEQGGGKPAIINCPACGAENIQGTDSCTNCGNDLRTLDIPPATWAPGEGPPGEAVEHLAKRDAFIVGPEITVGEVIAQLRDAGYGSAIVVEGERVVGIFTERDVLFKVTPDRAGALDLPVRDLMTADPVTLHPEDSILSALNEMAVGGFRHLPLVDEQGTLRGILSGRDLLEHIERLSERR